MRRPEDASPGSNDTCSSCWRTLPIIGRQWTEGLQPMSSRTSTSFSAACFLENSFYPWADLHHVLLAASLLWLRNRHQVGHPCRRKLSSVREPQGGRRLQRGWSPAQELWLPAHKLVSGSAETTATPVFPPFCDLLSDGFSLTSDSEKELF